LIWSISMVPGAFSHQISASLELIAEHILLSITWLLIDICYQIDSNIPFDRIGKTAQNQPP
jgi:hypothetical protein